MKDPYKFTIIWKDYSNSTQIMDIWVEKNCKFLAEEEAEEVLNQLEGIGNWLIDDVRTDDELMAEIEDAIIN